MRLREGCALYDLPPSPKYRFTRDQLRRLLDEAVGLFLEFRDAHDREECCARSGAVAEVLEGLDAKRVLHRDGIIEAFAQLMESRYVALPSDC